MKSIYVGTKQALIFPALCEGYLRIDYSDQVAQQPIGIFGHEGSFTIEAIVTPYDANGNGYKLVATNNPAGVSGIVDSVKTFPNVQDYNTTEAQYQDYQYNPDSARINQVMMLFNSGSASLFLQNTTSTTHNQPSEYRIGLTINANGTDSLYSDTVITSRAESTGTVNYTKPGAGSTTDNIYHTGSNTVKYQAALAVPNAHTSGTNSFTTSGTENEQFWVGQELFTVSGQTFTSIGTVSAVDGSAVTMSGTVSPSVSGVTLYTHAYREAPYLLTSCHIAATFNATSGAMKLFYNGQEVATKLHSSASAAPYTFKLDENDLYIGQDPAIGVATQFFGEIHEFAVLSGFKTQYDTIFTLAPKFDRTLIYYRFEEVDL
jgi:hypothetical protein